MLKVACVLIFVCVDYHWPVLSMARESLLLLLLLLFLMEVDMAGLSSDHRGHLPIRRRYDMGFIEIGALVYHPFALFYLL